MYDSNFTSPDSNIVRYNGRIPKSGWPVTAIYHANNYNEVDTTNTYVDIRTDFYAYITNTAHWLYLTNDEPNVSAKSATYLKEQIWRFIRLDDGSYVIKSSIDGKCMDVDNSSTNNGTNVKTCSYYGNDAQKWYLINNGDNKYIIKSKLGNCVLDLANNSHDSGTNIQICEQFENDAQYYSIYRYDTPSSPKISVSTNKTSVEVHWDTVNVSARYDVYLIQEPYNWNNVKYSSSVSFIQNNYTFINVAPGSYSAFVIARPNDDNIQSNWVDFTINKEVCGDINQDGEVTISDVTEFQRYLANMIEFDDAQLAVADTNGDGNITIADVTQMQRYLAQLISSLG